MMRAWKTWLVLLLILLFGAFLRLHSLSEFPPGLYPDEAMNGNNALEAIHGAVPFKMFYPENNGREGLFINIQAFFLNFFIRQTGTIEAWMLRVPSALFGIFTLLGIFLLTREMLKFAGEKALRAVPLLATFFAAASFWHVNFSRIGFRAIMAPFFLTWGLYLLFVALEWLRNRNERPFSRMLPFIAGFVYGLGFHSYIAYRVTPLLVLGIFVWIWLNRTIHKRFWNLFVWFTIGGLCAVLPLVVFFINHPQDFLGRTSQISVFSSATPLWDLLKNIGLTLGSFFVYGDGNWRHNISGRPLLSPPVALFFLLGIVLLFRLLWKTFRKNKAALGEHGWAPPLLVSGSWIAVGSLPVVISNEGIPHALRSILIIPPIMIISAIGCIHFFSVLKRRFGASGKGRALIVIAPLVLALVGFDGYWSYFHVWGKDPNTPAAFANNYVAIAQELNLLPSELPKYVVVEAGGTDVRGIPMPAQTVMFLTDTFLPAFQTAKNIHYILPKQESNIPQGAVVFRLR